MATGWWLVEQWINQDKESLSSHAAQFRVHDLCQSDVYQWMEIATRLHCGVSSRSYIEESCPAA
jgi:hypothetical protein